MKSITCFAGGSEPPWEERLGLTWKNILSLSKNFIEHGFNVVIDFVVEDELEWFCKQTMDLQVELKYIELRAEEETLKERLNGRGDSYLIERSLFLLTPTNKPFLYNTTSKQPEIIAADIIFHNHNFNVSSN